MTDFKLNAEGFKKLVERICRCPYCMSSVIIEATHSIVTAVRTGEITGALKDFSDSQTISYRWKCTGDYPAKAAWEAGMASMASLCDMKEGWQVEVILGLNQQYLDLFNAGR